MAVHRRARWWARVRTVKLSTAMVIAVFVGAIITTWTMVEQKQRTDEAVTQANSVADPILELCGRGGDTAQRLTEAGLCNQAASVKVSGVISNPDSLVGEPVPGPQGPPGANGARGEKGNPGDKGEDGQDGSPATSMTLNGSGVVYTCRRSGGANTSPVYSCPGLGGVQPGFQSPAGMPFPQEAPGFPMPRPRPWSGPRATH